MKKYFGQVIGILTGLSMITQPVMASVTYSPNECERLANAIANGDRPPITREEAKQLDEQTLNQLTQYLSNKHSQPSQNIAEPVKDYKQANQTDTNRTIDQKVSDPATNQETPASRRPLSKSEREFIELIGHDAQQIAADHDLFASVMMAQAILESNWGRSDLAGTHYNLFGIKGTYQGQSVTLPTLEHHNGQDLKELGTFRKYPSIKASLEDYANVLDQEMYSGVHKRSCTDYKMATRNLSGNYATDPQYQHKLNQLIEAYHLVQYDQPLKKDQASTKKHPVASHYHLKQSNELPKKQSTKRKGLMLPIIGGVSSVSLVELIKRYVK
ncbi:glycoside hydrolase family 73 protein [uncultured Limosilactobacillus sp.]|uniref:glycoside hydrolase family 73 protein n=1 Tax=uncultured Limosilactobacillus sp. TaxID=2837629 RepID=UPI0026003626|nr:glycoside hydrolase family 73 protein [uncultured Limosilactobacillus sp.]